MSSNSLKSVNLTSSPVFKLFQKIFCRFPVYTHSTPKLSMQVVQAPVSIHSDFMKDFARIKYILVTPQSRNISISSLKITDSEIKFPFLNYFVRSIVK